jgi:HAD superfamily hydrolase (TIGR01549 family)
MSRAAPTAVVFDLDGTLVDSLPLVLAAIAHALEPYGGRPTMDIFAHLGGPPERFMAGLVDDPAHVPEAVRRMAEFHDGNEQLIQPFAGASELLARLRREGVRAGVWTGRDRLSTDRMLRRHGLAEAVGAVVCGDDLPSHKPDPAGLREVLRRLEVTAGEAIFVGDADVDVLGGAAAGVDTLMIRHARQIAPVILARSWRVTATPTEAYATIAGLFDAAS